MIDDTNFRLAFGFRWFNYPADQSLQYDPLNVRWIARLTSNEKGVLTKTDLPLHECNEEDFAEFYPIRDRDAETFNVLTAGSNSSFKCIDWNDSLSLKSQNIQNIEFILTECHTWPYW